MHVTPYILIKAAIVGLLGGDPAEPIKGKQRAGVDDALDHPIKARSQRCLGYFPASISDIILPFGILWSFIMYILPLCIIMTVPASIGAASLTIMSIIARSVILL